VRRLQGASRVYNALVDHGDHNPGLYQIPSILQYITRRSSLERGKQDHKPRQSSKHPQISPNRTPHVIKPEINLSFTSTTDTSLECLRAGGILDTYAATVLWILWPVSSRLLGPSTVTGGNTRSEARREPTCLIIPQKLRRDLTALSSWRSVQVVLFNFGRFDTHLSANFNTTTSISTFERFSPSRGCKFFPGR
jgi:hypothetical protein